MKEGTSSSKHHVSVVRYSLFAFCLLIYINCNKGLPFFTQWNISQLAVNSYSLYMGLIDDVGLSYIPVLKIRALFILCAVHFTCTYIQGQF